MGRNFPPSFDGCGPREYCVPDGQAFGHIDAQIMGPGQCGDKLKGERTKTADYSVSAADEDVLLTHHQAIGT